MRIWTLMGLVSAMTMGSWEPAVGQIHFGGHVSLAEDTDFGVGPRVRFDMEQAQNLSILGTFDWYFLDEDEFGSDTQYWELAGTLLYRFTQAQQVLPYVGGGLVLGHASVDNEFGSGSDNETGAHIMGGMGFRTEGRAEPFVDIRMALSGPEQFVISAGVLF